MPITYKYSPKFALDFSCVCALQAVIEHDQLYSLFTKQSNLCKYPVF